MTPPTRKPAAAILEIVLDFWPLAQRPFYAASPWTTSRRASANNGLISMRCFSFALECFAICRRRLCFFLLVIMNSFALGRDIVTLEQACAKTRSVNDLGDTSQPPRQLPVWCIDGLLPVLKAEQQFHLLGECGQETRKTNDDLVDHLQCSGVVLTIFIVLCLGQMKQNVRCIVPRG